VSIRVSRWYASTKAVVLLIDEARLDHARHDLDDRRNGNANLFGECVRRRLALIWSRLSPNTGDAQKTTSRNLCVERRGPLRHDRHHSGVRLQALNPESRTSLLVVLNRLEIPGSIANAHRFAPAH
jgi:hypothetical protein